MSRNAVLAAAIVASSMSYIDSTALTVALPVIKTELSASDAQAQAIVEGYLLFLASLILAGGALGDCYGRRRLFTLGIWIFTLSSIACALAFSPGVLIGARCIQGVGAALMIPGSLALITAAYDGPARGRAIGMWAAASAVTMAAGPVLGGWLTQVSSWRWVFWINIPPAIVALLLTYLRVDESRAKAARKPDLIGSAFITVALALLVGGLMRMQHRLGDPISIALLAAGLMLVFGFALVERRAGAPIVPLRLFASRAFTVASVYTFLLYAALGGALFFVPFELQHVMRYAPLQTGLSLVPTVALVAVGSPVSGALANRIGARTLLCGGATISALGFGLFAQLGSGVSYVASVLPPTMVLGVGLALAIAPLIATAMGAADAEDAGSASGVNNAISRVGNLVAIAALGIVIASAGDGALPTAAHPQGFSYAMLGAAAMSLLAALTALFLPLARATIRRPTHGPEPRRPRRGR